jgi:hypothetical protein
MIAFPLKNTLTLSSPNIGSFGLSKQSFNTINRLTESGYGISRGAEPKPQPRRMLIMPTYRLEGKQSEVA